MIRRGKVDDNFLPGSRPAEHCGVVSASQLYVVKVNGTQRGEMLWRLSPPDLIIRVPPIFDFVGEVMQRQPGSRTEARIPPGNALMRLRQQSPFSRENIR